MLVEQRVGAYADGKLVAVDRWSFVPHDDAYFHGRETYEYFDGRLIGIRSAGGRDLRLTYSPDGELLTIVTADDVVAYRRPVPGGVEQARTQLQTELPDRIVTWAKRVTPDEPVAFVALLYGETFSQVLPLMLVLATQREVDDGGTWYPGEYEIFDDDPDELQGLDEPAEVLNQEWRSTQDEDDARAFARSIAEAVTGLAFPVIALGPSL